MKACLGQSRTYTTSDLLALNLLLCTGVEEEKIEHELQNGFLLGYREDVVGCHVCFPTEHKKGFVSDVKINEFVKYKDHYESSYLTKVKKWLHTFTEPFQEGDLVAYANGDHDDASQLVEYDIESQQRVCSDI